jgi:hypothetical protein
MWIEGTEAEIILKAGRLISSKKGSMNIVMDLINELPGSNSLNTAQQAKIEETTSIFL